MAARAIAKRAHIKSQLLNICTLSFFLFSSLTYQAVAELRRRRTTSTRAAAVVSMSASKRLTMQAAQETHDETPTSHCDDRRQRCRNRATCDVAEYIHTH